MAIRPRTFAREWQITRAEQDALAVASQNKASAARQSGRFRDEIVPVSVAGRRGETVVADDEHIRDGVTAEGLARSSRCSRRTAR